MPGIDAWPARPSVDEPEAEHALLAYAERVHAPPLEVEHLPRALVDDHVAAHLLGNVVAQPLRAVGRTRLLVARDDDEQLAALGPPSRATEAARGGDLAGDLPLHVERAPPPDEAVLDLSRPRVDAPLGRVREHGVDVAQITEPLPVGFSAQARDQVRAAPPSRPPARTRSPAASSSERSISCAGRSLPGGFTVLKRISRWSSSVASCASAIALIMKHPHCIDDHLCNVL